MALAFDAVASTGNNVGTNPMTWTHTPVGTPSGVGILVAATSAATITTVTYGGTTCTFIGRKIQGNDRMELWELPNPPAGAQTVSVTLSAGPAFEAGISMTVTGGDTANVFTAANFISDSGAPSAAATPSVTVTSATGQLVLDGLFLDNANVGTVGSGQTSRVNAQIGTTSRWYSASTEPGAASVVMDWTTTFTTTYVHVAAPFKAAAAAGGSLFRSSNFNGLQSGGPFFANPIG